MLVEGGALYSPLVGATYCDESPYMGPRVEAHSGSPLHAPEGEICDFRTHGVRCQSIEGNLVILDDDEGIWGRFMARTVDGSFKPGIGLEKVASGIAACKICHKNYGVGVSYARVEVTALSWIQVGRLGRRLSIGPRAIAGEDRKCGQAEGTAADRLQTGS